MVTRASAEPTEAFWLLRHPAVPGLELKHVRAWPSVCAQLVTESIKLVVSADVGFRYGARGSSWLVRRGAIAVVEPGAVHSASPAEQPFGVDALMIDPPALLHIDPESFRDLRGGFSLRDPVCTSDALRRAIGAVGAALDDPSSSGLLVHERTLAALVALQLVVTGRVPPATDDRSHRDGLRRAREMIHAHYTESLRLDALADVSGLPKLRFLRSFKRVFGATPHDYQMHVRLDHARQAIARGRSISEASAAAGFCDQSHFHRHFLRRVGVTPGEYRSGQALSARDARGAR
jgi:AraC-like DNA-binding protein